MQLTKFTDNALRVLIYLAANPDQKVTVAALAEACNVPRNHLTKVIHTMALNGLVDTSRGKGGGVTMAKPANQLNVGDVVRAMEGMDELINCDIPKCPMGPKCDLRTLLRQGQNAFLDTMDTKTISDLVART